MIFFQRSLSLTQLGKVHSGKGVDGRTLSLLKFLTQPTAPLVVKWNEALCKGDSGSPKFYLHVSVRGSGLGKTNSISRVRRAEGRGSDMSILPL